MIRTIADIVKGFIHEEKKKLDEFSVNHAPTIGDMYEGLTNDVLNRVIPAGLELRIVSGFIHDQNDVMTGQIDCMLVRGEGTEVPYTSCYKWHIKDVIAVLEVKKTLYSNDLKDAFVHLREVNYSYSRYVEDYNPKDPEEKIDVSSARSAFAYITSTVPPSHRNVKHLDLPLEMLYHTLIMECISPIRIILGYHGFRSENSLRNSLIDFLKENNSYAAGFGVGSFPQLIISDKYSLIKINGQPYSVPLRNDQWVFYASSRSNPILLILELIWTRLSHLYKLGGLWGEDLDVEHFIPLIKGNVVKSGDKMGWNYNYFQFNEDELKEFDSSYKWEPVYLNHLQFTIITILCKKEFEEIDDPEFIKFVTSDGDSLEFFLKSLFETGLVGLEGNKIQLITDKCQPAILPSGQYIAAEDNSGRLTRWLLKNIIKKEGEPLNIAVFSSEE